MRKYYLPIICCFSVTTFAQTEINGTVHFTDHTPVAFADIVIKNEEKIIDEISTDENGNFTTILEDGTYQLSLEEAGITLYSQQLIVKDGKEIGLILVPKQENVALKETVITGQKKMIEKKVDRLIFNPDLAEGAKGGNALDALRLAPRIKVDESTDAISIIGKGSITVMINDRLMQMSSEQLANYLKTIRTEDIEKIEVITNPPAKYDATGNSGIVNIVLKNAKQESINGSLSTSYSYLKDGSYNVSGNVNFRKGNWTLTSNIYNGDGNWYNESNNHKTFPDELWVTENKNTNKNKYIGGRIGVDYQINDKLITGFNFDISDGSGSYFGDSNSKIYNRSTNQIDKYINTDSRGSDWAWNYMGINYHIIKKFDTDGKKLTFDFDYSKNGNDNTDKNISNELDANLISVPGKYQDNLALSNGKSDRYNVSIDMEHPVKEWKMNYGTRLRWANDTNDNLRFLRTDPNSEFTQLTQFDNSYQYKENVFALYYSLEKQLSEKWTAKMGLRYEHAKVKSIMDDSVNNYQKSYDGLYPTAYIMYQPAENHSLSLNYSRRVDRPFIWFLNPMLVKINDYNYSIGNPDLRPSNSNNIELEYAYKDLSVTSLYYRNADDLFEQVQLFDPVTKITTSKPFNIGKTYSIGISENINIKPVKWWKINASADVFYRKTTGGIPELSYTLDGWNGEFRITNNLELNKGKTLFANYTFSYETKSTDGLDAFGDYSRHNLGLRAMLLNKKLQLSFNVNNIFENQNPTYLSKSNNIESFTVREPFRMFRLGIAYNFGKQFQIERSKSNQEQSSSGAG